MGSSNSTKNLNVRFDPTQVPERSPHSSRPEPSSSRRHRSGRHRSSHHKRSSSRTRVIQEVSRTGSLPRSHSYSGRTGLGDRIMDEDERSECSTCSSSSSDSDDPYAYQLPPRKAYGGVRLSYVPNDRIRARNHQRSIQGPHSSEYVSQRRSMRGGSVQPQSLPPAAPRQQQQVQQQQQPQHQQLPPRHPDYHPMHHHHAQQPQPQQQQQQQQYAHPGPASGSSVGSKDKDKCIIS